MKPHLERLEDRCCPSSLGADAIVTQAQFVQQYQQAIQSVLLPAEATLVSIAQTLPVSVSAPALAGINQANNLLYGMVPYVQPLFAQTGQTTLGQLGEAETNYFVNVLLPGIEGISF
jgi:hypothetical protein